jgi:CDP-glucose 4,6-dehydratase
MLGAEVFGYSLPPLDPSLYRSIYGGEAANGIFADIRDREILRKELESFAPDVVFHLAAQPIVRESYKSPALTYETNVMGTVNLLEAARSSGGVSGVVVITTDKCYRDMDWEWGYRETDALGGADPYSSSKACAELVCEAWRGSYFNNGKTLIASARAGNVIGGGDWAADRIVPDAIRAFQDDRRLEIRSPKSIRPWQHVMEPLAGYMLLAKRLCDGDARYASAWNFGPLSEGCSRDVETLAGALASAWGGGAGYEFSPDSSFHESRVLRLDSSRAIQDLGWRPKLTFEDTVALTVEWYRRVWRRESALWVIEAQIREYEKRR